MEKEKEKLKAIVSKDGKRLTFIYDDKLQPLIKAGKVSIKRVSNVEPTENGKWRALMTDGTVLPEFDLREDALRAEREYLENKLFSCKE